MRTIIRGRVSPHDTKSLWISCGLRVGELRSPSAPGDKIKGLLTRITADTREFDFRRVTVCAKPQPEVVSQCGQMIGGGNHEDAWAILALSVIIRTCPQKVNSPSAFIRIYPR